MALEKVVYEDKKTVISAKNLNDIQDAIIDLERNKGKLLGRLEFNLNNCVSEESTIIDFREEFQPQVQALLTACKEATGGLLITIFAYDYMINANACYSGASRMIGFSENISASIMNTNGDGLDFVRISALYMESTNTLFPALLNAGKRLGIEVYEI